MEDKSLLAVNTIRFLSAEAVQAASSGHPGLPLGAAPAAWALWSREMKHNPANPQWEDRDRFVLSAGHGSSMLYALLTMFGYGLTFEDMKKFRQIGSLTPGHPEYRHTAGVEVTTGPLGQGIANAVGFAWAENVLATKFNRPGFPVIDHYTYAMCGDGCMMEGISSEAASLAGTLGLGKLILLYDSNQITIEGSTDIAFRENVAKRFEAYNWHVQIVEDGTDVTAIQNAIQNAKNESDRPSLIEVRTVIGQGAPNKQGKASAHGEPLGAEEIRLMKEALGWTYPEFHIPAEVGDEIGNIQKRLASEEDQWNALMKKYAEAFPELYQEWELWHCEEKQKELFDSLLNDESFWTYEGNLASRISSELVLNKVAQIVPFLIGGSADLAPSTKTIMKGRGDYSKETPEGFNLHFGIREHAMTAIANGMTLHGGLRAYVAGFFVFSDYMKPSMRLSAMMGLPVIHIMTHDSIGVGEDGPTHEPVEQMAALRATPNFTVIRPCDTKETAAAWYLALSRTKSPTALVLSRQNLTLLPETGKGALRGGYILRDSENPEILLIASGSEVALAYQVCDVLNDKGISARVVSMPSMEIFDEQPEEYKESVLPKNVRARLAVEAGCSFGWHKYTGLDGRVLSIDTFGASGPYGELFKEYGYTVERVTEAALELLKKK